MTMFTDIARGGLVAALPPALRPYARLMRLDRPIGTWLLLLPCWWGLALAVPGLPNLWLMLLFALGALIMRGAGCVINDIYDRHLDRSVERTQSRPLASGEISLIQALFFLGMLLLLGLGILLCFNRVTILTGIVSLLLVAIYPLMKRVTWWPQLFLGFTFNWGLLLGSCAAIGRITLPVIIAYAAGICWTLGYDTIYAHQDIRDDEAAGIKSTARLFGDKSKQWIAGFYTATIIILALAGWVDDLRAFYYWGLGVAAIFAAWQLTIWDETDQHSSLARFRANRDFALIVFGALLLGQWK